MKISSVLGPIDTRDMGLTLMHEHVVNIDWNFARAFPGFYDREATVEMFCEEMARLKPLGLRTLVDATPITLGRDAELFKACAERAEINFIACTGFYWHEAPFYHWGAEPRVIADYLEWEVVHGIEGSGALPAFFKCASAEVPGETAVNRALLEGTALAHLETGLPIQIHAAWGTRIGLYQMEVLRDCGVDMKNVYFCHAAMAADAPYVETLMDAGAFVGVDQLPYGNEQTFRSCAELIARETRAGRGDRLMLSCDSAVRSDFGRTLQRLRTDRQRNRLIKEHARERCLFGTMLPLLRELGLEQADIDRILIVNPRRFFGDRED